MTTLQLRDQVIGKLSQINDDRLLAEVFRMLENAEDDTDVYQLSQGHNMAVEEGIIQLNQGNFLTNSQANQEIDKWLKR